MVKVITVVVVWWPGVLVFVAGIVGRFHQVAGEVVFWCAIAGRYGREFGGLA
ncbi:hypothetical protein ABFA25_00505 [Mycobacterium lepromatosis]|uniref:hypothetical protein n=1 Tax=Mycobacterium lepromatosis TaxID=480418 RepID=UPI003D800D1C